MDNGGNWNVFAVASVRQILSWTPVTS